VSNNTPERRGINVPELLEGVPMKEWHGRVVRMIAEDMMAQAMVEPSFSGGDLWRLLKEDPQQYMDLHLSNALYYSQWVPTGEFDPEGRAYVRFMHCPEMDELGIDGGACSEVSNKMFGFQEGMFRMEPNTDPLKHPSPFRKIIGNTAAAAAAVLQDAPRYVGVDVRLDMTMPPRAAGIFGERGQEEYRELMRACGTPGAGLTSLFRVCLFPMPVRVAVEEAVRSVYEGDREKGETLTAALSEEFCGYNITLDLALYCAAVNYKSSVYHALSDGGLKITPPWEEETGEGREHLVLRLTEPTRPGACLPVGVITYEE
jgi:hypothetical protein